MQLGRLILPILKAGGSGWDDLYDILIMINSIAEYKNVEPEFILRMVALLKACKTFFNPEQHRVETLAASFDGFDGTQQPRVCLALPRAFLKTTSFPFGRVCTEPSANVHRSL